MDIEYLLLLQRLREAAGAVLTPLMELVSELAASSVTIGAAAFIFWAVDRHFGGFLMLNYVGSSLLTQIAKLTACVYRPWVRDSRVYPVVYFQSDTTGEKDFEEFYVPGEQLNMERFASLGVIENVQKRPMLELETFFNELESIFHEPGFTKAEVVAAIKRFLPNFEHVEKGKNLDQKM